MKNFFKEIGQFSILMTLAIVVFACVDPAPKEPMYNKVYVPGYGIVECQIPLYVDKNTVSVLKCRDDMTIGKASNYLWLSDKQTSIPKPGMLPGHLQLEAETK